MQYLPVFLIISSPENNWANFDSRKVAIHLLVSDHLIQFFFPQTTDPIDSTNLLLNHAGIPLWVQQHNRTTCLVKIKPLTAHQRLRYQYLWVTLLSIKGQLQEAPSRWFCLPKH